MEEYPVTIIFFIVIIIFCIGGAVGAALAPTTNKDMVICEHEGGTWHDDICIVDGKVLTVE